MSFSVRSCQEFVLRCGCEGEVTAAQKKVKVWPKSYTKKSQNNIPKIPNSHKKPPLNPVFWEASASPVCWLKTGRKSGLHIRRSGVKQPPQFLFALMGQNRGGNFISEEILLTKLLIAPGDLWQALQSHKFHRLFSGPPCPVSATNETFWTSILDSTGTHLGHCLPLKLAFPVLWAKLIPFLLLFPSCSGDGFPTGNIGIITHRSINEVGEASMHFLLQKCKIFWWCIFSPRFSFIFNNLND